MKQKLPIGLQNLREMRTQGYVYVDKTAHVARLAAEGKYYFLARPRRFGKSLLVDTLAEAFAGRRELFAGLYLEHHWDWSRSYPVLRFDFSTGVLQSREELDRRIGVQLAEQARRWGRVLERDGIASRFEELVLRLAEAAGAPVVVLIDEYDKPILDNLDTPDRARAMREGLRNFYSAIKGLDPHLKFVLLTGVSKFSKVSLFSGLNNLEDLTLDPRAATLCGYTQAELAGAFADYLDGVDLAEVRRWYNGYNFLGEPVYNPFDILLYLRHREFRPYWFETGTPTFLVELLRQRRFVIPEADDYWASEELLGAFEVDAIRTRGAAVPDRLRHRARAAGTPQRLLLPAGFSQPRSAGQPAPGGAAALRPQPARAAAGRRADVPGAGARRSRGSAPRLARLLRVHPPRLVPAQRPGRLRRLLGLAGLLPVRRPGGGDPGRGTWQSRPGGPGDRVSGPGVAAGIQGGRTGRRPAGAGANQGPGLPPPLRRPAGDPDRDGLQRGTAQPDRLRLGAGVSGPVSQNFCDPYKNASLYPISKRVVTQFHPIERRNPHGTPSITPPTLYILLILLSIFTLPAWAVLPTAGTWVTDQNKEFTISSSGVISGLTIAVWSSFLPGGAGSRHDWDATFDAIQIGSNNLFSSSTGFNEGFARYSASVSGDFSSSQSVTLSWSASYVLGGYVETGRGSITARPADHVGPNLTPLKPDGWSDKIVVSNTMNTTTDSSPLKNTDTLYVDWAVINDGGIDAGIFAVDLYVDNVKKFTSPGSAPLKAGFFRSAKDTNIGSLGAGTHTLKVVIDAANAVAESNEDDNTYQKTITIYSSSSSDKQLTSGVTLNGESVAAGAWNYYFITVPAGATDLTVATTNSTADVDLYTRFGSKPTESSYSCRPFKSSGNEICSATNPTAGTWWIGVNGYRSGSYSVTATVSGGGAVPKFSVGVFRAGSWFLDANGNGAWDRCQQDGGLDLCLYNSFGAAGDMPAAGNWDGGAKSSIGVLRAGTGEWFVDRNGNHQWDGCVADGCYAGFGMAGDLPVAGDWNGTGFAKIGVFRSGQWFLDANGNGQWDGCGTDLCLTFGQFGDLPVAGNWDGGTKAGAGVFRAGTWYLDYNGNGQWDGCQQDGGQDRCLYNSFGQGGDLPAAGDWNGDGTAKVGVFRNGTWYLDYNGNGAWDGCGIDRCYEGSFGMKGDLPVAGQW